MKQITVYYIIFILTTLETIQKTAKLYLLKILNLQQVTAKTVLILGLCGRVAKKGTSAVKLL